jgi:hypothetical protein
MVNTTFKAKRCTFIAILASTLVVFGCGGSSTSSPATSLTNASNCPAGQTQSGLGVCYVAPAFLAKNIKVLNESAFLLLVTDYADGYPTQLNTFGGNQSSVDFTLASDAGVVLKDSTGQNIPVTIEKRSNPERGGEFTALSVTLKSPNKVVYGSNYSLTLNGLTSFWNGNRFYSDNVNFATPSVAWTIPKTCGTNSSEPCTFTTACTVQNKCQLIDGKTYYFSNLEDSGLLDAIAIGVNPISGFSKAGSTTLYTAEKASGILKVANSVVAQTTSLFDYAFLSSNKFLYLNSPASSTFPRRYCARAISSRSPLYPMQVPTTFCDTGTIGSPWTAPTDKIIGEQCTSSNRCILDNTSNYYLESPTAIDRTNKIGWIISNSTASGNPAQIKISWFFPDHGPFIPEGSSRFPETFIFNASGSGSLNTLGPIRSAYWNQSFLYLETNQSGQCVKYGEMASSAGNSAPLVTACP